MWNYPWNNNMYWIIEFYPRLNKVRTARNASTVDKSVLKQKTCGKRRKVTRVRSGFKLYSPLNGLDISRWIHVCIRQRAQVSKRHNTFRYSSTWAPFFIWTSSLTSTFMPFTTRFFWGEPSTGTQVYKTTTWQCYLTSYMTHLSTYTHSSAVPLFHLSKNFNRASSISFLNGIYAICVAPEISPTMHF